MCTGISSVIVYTGFSSESYLLAVAVYGMHGVCWSEWCIVTTGLSVAPCTVSSAVYTGFISSVVYTHWVK